MRPYPLQASVSNDQKLWENHVRERPVLLSAFVQVFAHNHDNAIEMYRFPCLVNNHRNYSRRIDRD
jgi:hypothetical protein